ALHVRVAATGCASTGAPGDRVAGRGRRGRLTLPDAPPLPPRVARRVPRPRARGVRAEAAGATDATPAPRRPSPATPSRLARRGTLPRVAAGHGPLQDPRSDRARRDRRRTIRGQPDTASGRLDRVLP